MLNKFSDANSSWVVIRRYEIIITAIILISNLQGQLLHGQFTGPFRAGTSLFLLELYGGQLRHVDTTNVESDGSFQFNETHYPLGAYHLATSPRVRVKLYLNPEEDEVHLRFKSTLAPEEMEVLTSRENQAAAEYTSLINEQFRNEWETMQKFATLPSNDKESIREVKRQLRELGRDRKSLLQKLRRDYGETFFGRITEMNSPMIGNDLELNKQEFFSSGFLASNEFVGSSVIPSKLVEYLSIYTDQSIGGFIDAVDEILFQAVGDEEVYGLSLDFLLVFFDRQGPDELFYYLLDEYLVDERLERYSSEHTKERIAVRRMVAPGALAQDFSLPDLNGNSVKLSEMVSKNDMSLLFFWRSGCPHCMETMPKLKAIYNDYRQTSFEIIAISLDEVERDWSRAIEENDIDWINISDLKGWDSEASEIYGVNQTPSFILINREMRIEKNSSELMEVLAFLEAWRNTPTR